jgi:predicted  nucleic acid-binding Zn-ribbon protein
MALNKDSMRALVALQDKDKVLDAIQKEIDSVPPRIAAVKSDLANEKKRMDAAKAKTIELEKGKKSKELDAAAKEESARKHAGQLNEVKTNEAYKALQVEIEKERAVENSVFFRSNGTEHQVEQTDKTRNTIPENTRLLFVIERVW